jgi:hypothetical protein
MTKAAESMEEEAAAERAAAVTAAIQAARSRKCLSKGSVRMTHGGLKSV